MKKLGFVVALCVVVGLLFAFQTASALDKPADAKAAKTTPAAEVKKDATSAPAADVVYHGNKKTKVFHKAGCKDYDCKNCTEKFASKEDAVKAGYKAHKCVGK